MDEQLPDQPEAGPERAGGHAASEQFGALPPAGPCCWDPEIICIHLRLAEAQWKREEAAWREAGPGEPDSAAEVAGAATTSLGEDFAVLAATPGGPQLAHLLAGLDGLEPRLLGRAQQLELAAAAKRLEAWAASVAVAATGAMAEPVFGHDATRSRKATAVDLAMRLGVSAYQGGKLVKVGAATERVLTGTRAALAAGQIDYSKARVLVETLEGSPATVAWAVEHDLLPAAPAMTTRELQEAAQQALIEVDPDDAEHRHLRARAARHVSRIRLRADGMASITAVLPAEDCAMIDQTLTAMAKTARNSGEARNSGDARTSGEARTSGKARTSGEARTTDQLRADALVSLTAAGILTATTDPIEQLSQVGPAPAQCPNPLAAEILKARPYERLAVTRPDIRVTIPWDLIERTRPEATPPEAHPPETGGPAADPGQAGPAGAGDPPPTAAPPEPGPPDPLAALDNAPAPAARLTGYGAIPAMAALSLLAIGAVRRLVTDPISGDVLDVGRRHRAPPPRLAELIRHRDGTCTRPGCSHPIDEIDHITPWAHGGPTDATNLQGLCTSCHNLKTDGLLRLTRAGEHLIWTTSTGHTYTRTTHGTAQLTSIGEPPY